MGRRHRRTGRCSRGRVVRPVLTALAALAAMTAVHALAAPPLLETQDRLATGTHWSHLPFGLLLSSLAATTLTGCGLWLSAVTVATAVEALTGASWALVRAVSPLAVRRLVFVCCGLAVGGMGVLTPAATAAPPGGDEATQAPSRGAGNALAGLSLPDRALGTAGRGAPAGAGETDRHAARENTTAAAGRIAKASAAATVVAGRRAGSPRAAVPALRSRLVRPDDSLWSIAEQLSPAGAGPDELDAAWRRIYRANRRAIGPDPDLIIPGTTLRLPGSSAWPAGEAHNSSTDSTPHRKDAS